MIGIEKKLFKCPSVPEDILRNGRQTAVTLVDVFDLPIAASKDGNTFEHRNRVDGGGGGGEAADDDDDDQRKVRRMRMR